MTNHYSGLINQLVDQAKAMFKETDPANGKWVMTFSVQLNIALLKYKSCFNLTLLFITKFKIQMSKKQYFKIAAFMTSELLLLANIQRFLLF
jgi:hypothetical protein